MIFVVRRFKATSALKSAVDVVSASSDCIVNTNKVVLPLQLKVLMNEIAEKSQQCTDLEGVVSSLRNEIDDLRLVQDQGVVLSSELDQSRFRLESAQRAVFAAEEEVESWKEKCNIYRLRSDDFECRLRDAQIEAKNKENDYNKQIFEAKQTGVLPLLLSVLGGIVVTWAVTYTAKSSEIQRNSLIESAKAQEWKFKEEILKNKIDSLVSENQRMSLDLSRTSSLAKNSWILIKGWKLL